MDSDCTTTTSRTAAAHSSPHVFEYAFAVFAAMVYSRALLFHLFPAGAASLPKTALYLSIYAITALLLLRHWRAALTTLATEKSVLALLLLACLSVLWSTAPGVTLQRAAGVGGGTLFAVYLVVRLRLDYILAVLGAGFAVSLAASLTTVALYPQQGIMAGLHEGLWSGAYGHKNLLGKFVTTGGAVFMALAIRRPPLSPALVTGVWCALFVLVMASSKSSMLAWSILFSGLGIYLIVSGRRALAATALLSSAIVLAAFVLQSGYKIMPSALQKETTRCASEMISGSAQSCDILDNAITSKPPSAELSTARGRLSLWLLLAEKIRQRPILGYGLGGFWLGEDGPSAEIWQQKPWLPSHAHNGFIDLALHLGLLGLGICLLGILAAAVRVLRRLRRGELDSATVCMSTLVAAVILVNIGESALLASNNLLWITLATGLLLLCRPQRDGGDA
ncbi:MAG: hypothetical protein CME59_12785 [Halioglobus sp.]|nr:hypothetical protein [Halioglobus sp.]|tara:strand:+ start:244 stop:1593 length:1350 start_codon:yes stop_codon:yes gene_type:complete